MVISHIKHSYLNWRAIPYRKQMICVYAAFFQHILWIWLSWFLFGLSRIFKCMTWQSIFFLFFYSFIFFFFLNGPLWAMSHVVDGLPTWNISSHMRIILKGLAFGSRLLVSFLSRGKIWLKSILEKWAISGQCASRHQSRWFQSITILGLVLLVIERVW